LFNHSYFELINSVIISFKKLRINNLQYNKQDIYEKITNEQKLIIVLCKIKLEQDDLNFIRSNSLDSFDWSYIFSFSQKHGISSLIYSNISKHLDSKVPTDVLNSFRKSSLENSKKKRKGNMFFIYIA